MRDKHFVDRNRKICTYEQKFCYDENRANMILLMNSLSNDNEHRKECRKYFCKKCNYFHLTSKPNKVN